MTDVKHADVVKFVDEPISHLKCPICKKCYTDPVINGNVSCGHTFCRCCTVNLDNCPIDSSLCDRDKLVVNRLVVGQINDLLIYCPFGLKKHNNDWVVDASGSGCPETCSLGNLEEHKKVCQFMLVPCFNNDNCGQFKRNELKIHLDVCGYTPCPNCMNGCEYRGTASSISSHLEVCSYKSSSNNVQLISRTISLEKANISLQKDVSFLKEKVTSLESSRNELSSQLNTCISSLITLQQKFDILHSLVEQSLSTPTRRSLGNSVTGSSRSLSSSSNSPSTSPINSPKIEHWESPFQFKCIGTLRGHKDMVWCLAIYHGKLYSAGSDIVIKVWDLDTLAKGCIENLQGHKKRIHCSCVGGGCLYTAGDDLSIKQWNVTSGVQPLIIENAHDNTICSMIIHGEDLYTSSFSLIKVWNSKSLTLKHTISGLNHWVRAMALNSKKDKLYSGSHNTINIWDTSTFESVGIIEHDVGSVYSVAVTKQYVIAGTFDQNIQLFDVNTWQTVIKLEGHFGAVTCLVVSPSGNYLFSGSHDHNIQMWNLETFLPTQTLSRHQGSVNTLALYGNILLSGSEDREIKVYRYFQSPL